MKSLNINFRKSAIILFSIFAVYSISALLLIHLSEPVFGETLDPQAAANKSTSINYEQNFEYQEKYFLTRDGINLYANHFKSTSSTTILLLHGILGNNVQFNTSAGLISENTQANVITLDLRGHGKSEGQPGDINYIDQYVDDVSDVIGAIRKEAPGQQIILAGHSMGGGIITRYVMNNNTNPVDGYILFAPAWGWESPTTRKETSPENEKFAQVHIARFIGLAMLNSIQIKLLNHKPVLFFNLQKDEQLVQYTYRSLVSMTPDDVNESLSKFEKPLLVIVGSQDEVFHAEEFEPLVSTHSKGETHVIENADHNSVHYCSESMALIQSWLLKHTLVASK